MVHINTYIYKPHVESLNRLYTSGIVSGFKVSFSTLHFFFLNLQFYLLKVIWDIFIMKH